MQILEEFKNSQRACFQGLSLEMDVEQEQYIGLLADGAGVRVLLHRQGLANFPYTEGFSISPGTSTSVAINKVL